MIAILLPLQMGKEWFTTAWSLVAAVLARFKRARLILD